MIQKYPDLPTVLVDHLWKTENEFKYFKKEELQDIFIKNKQTKLTSNMSDRKLAEELSKPIIRKFEKGKAYSSFKDNISDADLADIQLISKFNKEFWFLLSFIEIYSKYALVIPLKNKKVITITKAFQNMLDESGHISNKI